MRDEDPQITLYCHELNALLEAWQAASDLAELVMEGGCPLDERWDRALKKIQSAHHHYHHSRTRIQREYGPKFERPRHNEPKN